MRPADKIRTLPDYLQYRAMERLLRRAGFTAREAKAIISDGFKSLKMVKCEQDLGGVLLGASDTSPAK
jgi:hypothetical protein